MSVAKYKIVRKCPVCEEEFFARTLESWYYSPNAPRWRGSVSMMKKNANLNWTRL